jgi:anti-sigma regulatory factor (Ser/Thr protein kinase)
MLWEWQLDELSEATELVVSELITNAIQATVGQQVPAPVRFRLSSDESRALVEVWDVESRPPQPGPMAGDGVPDLDAESGRGLLLVATLSKRWGWYPERECGGKVVWAELLL